MIYLQLFFEFFKAGLFAIGGGLATIPFLTDIGQRTGWFTSGELANMIAISESTPRLSRNFFKKPAMTRMTRMEGHTRPRVAITPPAMPPVWKPT